MAIVIRYRKDGTPSYQVKVKDGDGQWFPTPAFENLDEAKAEEARLEGMKRKGAKSVSMDARKTNLSDYWLVWKEDRRTETSDGWKISQDQMFEDHVEPILGDKKLSKVDKPHVGRVLAAMKKKGLSEQMRLHVYSLMNQMFRDAVSYYEMLVNNPVSAEHHRPKVKDQERSFLRPAQAWTLLETARSHEYLGPAVWVQVLSGLRPEAMQGLLWTSIQWDLGQILICRAWKQKVGRMEEYPKGGDWEYVPMPPILKRYLWELWESSSKDPLGFVCRGIKGGMLPYETYLRAIRRLCKDAGVPVVTPHELRHSCTELYVEQGATTEDLRRLLNHANADTTKKYVHRTDERLTALAERIGNFPNSFSFGKKEAVRADEELAPNVH